MKKGYWIALVDVTDPDNYPKYIAANKVVFDRFGASFLVRGGEGQVMEGPAAARRVIIEFESYAQALACYESPEYQAALKLRQACSTAHLAIVEGV